jgi:hypothetical protein
MLKRVRKSVTGFAKALWCNRVVYAGAALAYGSLCVGIVDKDVANQVLTGCYIALVVQRP